MRRPRIGRARRPTQPASRAMSPLVGHRTVQATIEHRTSSAEASARKLRARRVASVASLLKQPGGHVESPAPVCPITNSRATDSAERRIASTSQRTGAGWPATRSASEANPNRSATRRRSACPSLTMSEVLPIAASFRRQDESAAGGGGKRKCGCRASSRKINGLRPARVQICPPPTGAPRRHSGMDARVKPWHDEGMKAGCQSQTSPVGAYGQTALRGCRRTEARCPP